MIPRPPRSTRTDTLFPAPTLCRAANVNDVTQAHGLLHGQETVALGDAGYQGVAKRPQNQDAPVTWHVALRPGVRRALPNDALGRLQERIEQVKAGLRSAEHTSELQSLMRISYAVFCLKKKKT